MALFAISRVTRDIRAMQLLHLLIGLASTGLVVAKAPFSRLARATYAFGYFPLFEYLAISRQYSLGVLLAVSYACLSWRQTPGPSWLRVLVLIGLSLTSVQGLIVAAGLVMGSLANPCRRPQWSTALTTVPVLAATAVLLIPPSDSGVRYPWVLGLDRARLRDSLDALARPLVPIPRLTRKFWETSVISITPLPTLVAFLLLAAAFFGIAWLVRRDRVALVPWLVAGGDWLRSATPSCLGSSITTALCSWCSSSSHGGRCPRPLTGPARRPCRGCSRGYWWFTRWEDWLPWPGTSCSHSHAARTPPTP